jgi:hypothetical protein
MTQTISPEDTGSRLVVDRSLGETQDLTKAAAAALAAAPSMRRPAVTGQPHTTGEIPLWPTGAELVVADRLAGPSGPKPPLPPQMPKPGAPKPSVDQGAVQQLPALTLVSGPEPLRTAVPYGELERLIADDDTVKYVGRHRLTLRGRLRRIVGARS